MTDFLKQLKERVAIVFFQAGRQKSRETRILSRYLCKIYRKHAFADSRKEKWFQLWIPSKDIRNSLGPHPQKVNQQCLGMWNLRWILNQRGLCPWWGISSLERHLDVCVEYVEEYVDPSLRGEVTSRLPEKVLHLHSSTSWWWAFAIAISSPK